MLKKKVTPTDPTSIATLRFGQIVDLTFEEYLEHPAVSRSDLEKLRITPAHLKYFKENPQEETAAMCFGQALHAKLLGGFDQAFAVWTGAVRRGKAFDEFKAKQGSKTIITQKEFDLINTISENILNNPMAHNLISKAQKEVSIEFQQEGVNCKARLDGFTSTTAFDIKTISDISNVERAILNYGYHRQAAWYLEALKAAGERNVTEFVFIFIEKSAPHSVRFVKLDPSFLEVGANQNEEALKTYKECLAEDSWPAFPLTIETIECPAWLLKEELLNGTV